MTTWKDIDISLSTKNNGDINDMEDEEAVRNSLWNIFKTMKGSRRMIPSFALNIHNYLFEPLDTLTALDIGNEIYNALKIWDSRIEVIDLLVKPDYDNSQYNITLKYKIKTITDIQTFNTTLYKL